MDAAETREFLLRALALADYSFPVYKTKDREKKTLASVSRLAVGRLRGRDGRRGAGRRGRSRGSARSCATSGTRRRTTSSRAISRGACAEEARARGLRAKILDKKAIRREKMGGLLAVNRGSAEEPRVVVLEWNGGKKGDPPLAFVGKGVTFDSGGISIKPSEKMGDMKWDMMGAATAMGIVLAAADLKLPVNVVGVAALTENLPSGTAYKPGDIVRFRNGKTAEIDNTDAEGRVILADALDYAADWKPAAILDFATLTGAALIALGLEAAILFTDHDDLSRALVSAGERTDERHLAPPDVGGVPGEHPLRLGRHEEHGRAFRRVHQRGDVPQGVRRPEDPVGAPRHRGDRELRPRVRRLPGGRERLRRGPRRALDAGPGRRKGRRAPQALDAC